MKTLLILFMMIVFANSYGQVNDNFYHTNTSSEQKSPSFDTIYFTSKYSDTIAVFKTKEIICYTDGAELIQHFIHRIKELSSLIDSTNINDKNCLENYQSNFKQVQNQLANNKDTIYLNELSLLPNSACGINDDILATNLSFFTFKVYNLKNKMNEPYLINKKVHKNHRIWYDQFQTKDGVRIYKGTGTLDKY